MILDHIPDGAGLVVEGPTALDAEVLRHRDLDALHVMSVPERLEARVRKPEEPHVVHGTLAQIVVGTHDRRLVQATPADLVQLTCGAPVRPERLLHYHSACGVA